VFFHVSLGHFVLVLLAFVLLCLVSSALSQEIGREERIRNDLFCVKCDVKPLLGQLVSGWICLARGVAYTAGGQPRQNRAVCRE